MKRPPPQFKLQFSPKDILAYAARYAYAYDEKPFAAGQKIVNGDYSRENLTAIFIWKTKGRGFSRIERNSDAEIADILRLAVEAKTERAAVAVLLGLSGVDVPVASAILTAIDQRRYTVIDFRALEALGTDSRNRSVEFYLAYLAACRSLAAEHGVELRVLDRALWQWSKEHGKSG
jgi:hypothetical protein